MNSTSSFRRGREAFSWRLKSLVLLVLSLALLFPSFVHARDNKPVRNPAVAGRFYPGDPKILEREVLHFLEQCEKKTVPGKVMGIAAPHAGYPYSGIVAAAAYSSIPKNVKKVIILGASHRLRYSGISIPQASAYRTPLGEVPIAREAAILLSKPGFRSLEEAHSMEHSIEVQLPFLQVILGDFKFIPILLGQGVNLDDLADALLPLVKRGFFIVSSTDLSHYHTYDAAQKLDAVCCEAIPSMDFEKMKSCEACGWAPTVALMKIAQNRKWKGVLLDYKNSGDTAGKMDKSRVVGYSAVAFYKPSKAGNMHQGGISPDDRKALLELARSAIKAKLNKDVEIKQPEFLSQALKEKRGCFVTLTKDGRLRGCIGDIYPNRPLMEAVKANAVNAAFRDYRFSPLTEWEEPGIEIEISVLTRPKELRFDSPEGLMVQIRPGIHGVIIENSGKRATYIPQVWEELPRIETFMSSLCRKGGMSPDAWKDPKTKIQVYEAEYFSEQ